MRLPSRIFWSPLHPTRTHVRCPYRSHLHTGCMCYHHPLAPPTWPLVPPLIPLLLPLPPSCSSKTRKWELLSIWSCPPKPLEISRSVSPIPSLRQISLPPKLRSQPLASAATVTSLICAPTSSPRCDFLFNFWGVFRAAYLDLGCICFKLLLKSF
jgi:hypothetical protein